MARSRQEGAPESDVSCQDSPFRFKIVDIDDIVDRCALAPHRPLVRTAPTPTAASMMQPTHVLPQWEHGSEERRRGADELVAKVKKEDLQWANDPERRRLLCWLFKGWYPVGSCADSAYDILTEEGGLGKEGLLQNIVHQSLQHPMTVVSCKQTDCALVLNRPCLRFKNINFKLAGFVRVDGSRYFKADAVQRYQDSVTMMPLVDELLDAAALGPNYRPFSPTMQRKGSWAFVDFVAMRARAHLPPDSDRACLTPPLPRRRRTPSATCRSPSTSCSRTTCTGTSRWWDKRCAEPRPAAPPPESRPTALRCCAGRLLRLPRGEPVAEARRPVRRDGALRRLGLRGVAGFRHRRHRRPRRVLGPCGWGGERGWEGRGGAWRVGEGGRGGRGTTSRTPPSRHDRTSRWQSVTPSACSFPKSVLG